MLQCLYKILHTHHVHKHYTCHMCLPDKLGPLQAVDLIDDGIHVPCTDDKLTIKKERRKAEEGVGALFNVESILS